MNNQVLHPRTIQVLNLISCHRDGGISTREMADILSKPIAQIYSSIETLVGRKQIKKGGRHLGTVWWIPMDAQMLPVVQPKKKEPTTAHLHRSSKLVKAVNGPGHTMRPLPVFDAPVQIPHKSGTVNGHYMGAELRPYEGRPEANDHMACGSMVGGVWRPYTPPGLMCVGAAGPVAVGGAQRGRFA